VLQKQKEPFLISLISELKSRYPNWRIEDHFKIEWSSYSQNLWPEADLLIETPGRRFIIEYDEDSDPGRSIIKYWPTIHDRKGDNISIIEIWRRGSTIGQGYAELAKWIGQRMMELYPGFAYMFIERADETVKVIAGEIAKIVEVGITGDST